MTLPRMMALLALLGLVTACDSTQDRRERANFKRFESYARAVPPMRGQALLYLIPVGSEFDFEVSIDGRPVIEAETPTAGRFLVFSLPPGQRKLSVEGGPGAAETTIIARPGETHALAVEADGETLRLEAVNERRARDMLVTRAMMPAVEDEAYLAYSNSLYRFVPAEDWW